MGYISNLLWARFKKTQTTYSKDVMNTTITWFKSRNFRNRYNEAYEDFPNMGGNELAFEPIELMCMVNYNYARSWPVDNRKEYGDIDEQSVQVFISVPDLKLANGSDDRGVFRYNRADYFVLDTQEWVYAGDTPASPIKSNENLVYTLILTKKIKPSSGGIL